MARGLFVRGWGGIGVGDRLPEDSNYYRRLLNQRNGVIARRLVRRAGADDAELVAKVEDAA